ncbi:MFS transporter [Bifidobacterium sp. ESL0732]|uniref:MFS transporter n=1 Tax=Bifidobacterium sp. ESL0732 TaxID=2983222 RepID=UPI0023F63623|nr:MFS transporter [Bifidobacterium sp. ESL0732]WEV64182.1 MFS transporter [Bifidobacterium sp. ESL0732]
MSQPENVPAPKQDATAEREPKGYVLTYSLAMYGLMICIMMPALGGLSIRLQDINNGNLKAATAQLSIVTGCGAIFALFAQPLFGRLSDRTRGKFGMRRPWIIAGVVGAGLSVAGIGFAKNMTTLLVLWCLAQTFSNMAQAAETATLPDQVPENRRGIVSGIAGACSPLGMLTGSLLLAVFSQDAPRFVVPGIIDIIFGIIFALVLKDKVFSKDKELKPLSVKEFFGSFVFNPRKAPDLGWTWLSKFFVMFGSAAVGSYLTLFLAAKFGMKTSEQTKFNLYFNIVEIGMVIIVSVLGGKLSDQFGKRRPFVAASGIIIALGVLLIAFAPVFGHAVGLVAILVGGGVMGGGSGLFFAVDMALSTEVLPSTEDTAKDLGVLNIANTLPQSIAPFIANWIIAAVGGAGFTVWFCIGAVVAVAGGITVMKVKSVE